MTTRQEKLDELFAPIREALERLDRLEQAIVAQEAAARHAEEAAARERTEKIAAAVDEYNTRITELRRATAVARAAQEAEHRAVSADYARAIRSFRKHAPPIQLDLGSV